jgi:hypothetical protein
MSISNKSDFCFILGRGRSGTTLLTSILNSNASISIAPESLFIMNTYRKYSGSVMDEKATKEFIQDIWLESRMLSWGLDEKGLLDWLLKYGLNRGFATACEIVYARYAFDQGKSGAKCIGDKNPHYSLFVETLIELFPDAKFIYLVRDYRANIASYKNVQFDSDNVAALSYRWVKYNKMVKAASERYPEKFILVRFEDLVEDGASEVKKICDFLSVPFMVSMLDYYKNDSGVTSEWHKNLNRPLNSEKIDSWNETLSELDVAVAESVCGKMGLELNYIPASSGNIKVHWWLKRGVILGWSVTKLERILFLLPIGIRSMIIKLYRVWTGSHSFSGERLS